mmetsp:Transcript_5654/g.17612  ORF Transcript_5654/g.17612 Transcript_5654/m.17612 type:complete len:111 (+) Transcript_5654:573-905(+)
MASEVNEGTSPPKSSKFAARQESPSPFESTRGTLLEQARPLGGCSLFALFVLVSDFARRRRELASLQEVLFCCVILTKRATCLTSTKPSLGRRLIDFDCCIARRDCIVRP